ncbi:MAG TPA: hypothetical protein VHS06_11620 [Chloroflexota bacterium]|nr:hypothetical protein [Chloroflexota bacterium]
MTRTVDAEDREVAARLAVIESKLEAVLGELSIVRNYIPSKMVEHSERIAVLERNLRTIQWVGSVFAAAIIGTFLAHILR